MSVNPVNKGLIRPLVLVSSVLGIIQAVTWILFSLLSIFLYFQIIKLKDETSGTPDYGFFMYQIFLNRDVDGRTYTDLLITPTIFNGLMYPYVVLSFFWLLASGYTMFAMVREKWNKFHMSLAIWAAITIIITILDGVVSGMLIHDYDYVDRHIDFSSSVSSKVPTTYGIVMSIAARGYLLWLVNLIFACIHIKFAIDLYKIDDVDTLPPIIDAYSMSLQPPVDKQLINKAFENDDNQFRFDTEYLSTFDEIPSSRPSNHNGYVQNPYENRFNENMNEYDGNNRLAKIGKVGRRTPPFKIQAPIIPPPDYTPPGSPKNQIKSALRSKSNYVI